ncbi:MAG TPA: hypothetical protein VGZ47_20185 [Gemmataceae bacterium]|nr:hypothetical protein [Gemmataceae bacterium]
MDWLVYAAYGLIGDDTLRAGSVSDGASAVAYASGSLGLLPEPELSLRREERPFCLWDQADGDFDKAVSLIPAGWSAARKALWKQRLEIIRDNEHVRRIEQPVYKRRWDEQWKVQNRWVCGQPAYDAEFLHAFDWWLSEKAEWWLEREKKGGPVELAEWAAALWADARVQAAWEVAAEVQTHLDRWKAEQKEEDAAQIRKTLPNAADFTKRLKSLAKEQSAPEGIPFAVPWEKIKQKVPAYVKSLRGKLNVPRERFWTTTEGSYKTPHF